jgi:serine/threonine protein kinase
MLLALHRLANPYLLSLFACYTHQGRHYLLTPYASGGNLRQFLEQERPEQYTQGSILYLISGLGSAIWALHDIVADGAMPNRKGHHQDIHHKNILFDGTNFLLADFGLSSLRSVEENSDTPHKSRQGYCQAPESSDLKRPYKEHSTTRAADIFSLGCIFTDLLVYFDRGPTGLQHFRESIRFTISEMTYTMYHKGDAPNEAVHEHLKGIATRHHLRASTGTLVRLITKMLNIDPGKRPKASDMVSELYVATITGFAEELGEEFERLSQHREAALERARCNSWIGALDATFFLRQSGPTTVAFLFKSIVDKLQRMVKALQNVAADCQTSNFADLVEVRQLNTELFSLLPAERKNAVLSQRITILMSDIGQEDVIPSHELSGDDLTLEPSIAAMASVKRLVGAVEYESHATKRRKFEASRARLLLEPHPDHSTFQLAKWKKSHSSPEELVIAESLPHLDVITREATQRRIRAIRDLLAGENLAQKIRVLPFRDLHFSAASGAWLVYDYPSNATDAKPLSLYGALGSKSLQICVSLETRIELASKLAESVATLHDMNWFHKDLTSSCVLFFHTGSTTDLEVCEPHLIGFQHSRRSSDASEGPSQDLSHQRYHHPRYIGHGYGTRQRFLPCYDFYSLGILLLEIGYWRTLAVITADAGPHHDGTFANNEHFSDHVREIVVPGLRSVTGSRYAGIVERCLTSAIGWQQDSEADLLNIGATLDLSIPTTLQFKKQVVEPLRVLAGSI